MRFKAKLAPEQVSLLCALVGSVKRLYEGEGSKKDFGGRSGGVVGTHLMGGSILRVDPHKLRLATTGKGDADGVAFFCELATHDGIFLEHRIDSASEDNAIAMEISLGELRVALRSIVANLENNGFRSSGGGGVAGGGGEDNINIRHSTTVLKLAKRDNIPCLCFDAFTRDGVVAVHHSIPVRIVRVPDAE
jgi:Hus1-like protein